jgi:DNA-binding NtrC family response regulator
VVTVCLPVGDLSEEPAGSEPAATTAAPARSEAAQVPLRPTALVVEDEPMLARLQATYLARMAITAVTVATGDDAVQYLRTHDVDMVISDVRMPGSVDGVQLFEWVREHRPALTARFLFVSGDLVGLNLGDFFERHAVPRIEKPFRLEEYQRQVRQILDAHWRPA